MTIVWCSKTSGHEARVGRAKSLLQHGAMPLGGHLLVAVRALQRNQFQRDVTSGRQVLGLIHRAEVARRNQVRRSNTAAATS